jgi:uroporphyrinogen-III decarboxylase
LQERLTIRAKEEIGLTGRERILAAIRGEARGRLPWTPRLDLWYRAHLRNRTLPEKWVGASMWNIIRDVGGLIYYPNIPTWRERLWGVEVAETVDGKVIDADQPMALSFSGRDVWGLGERWGKETVTEYRTPKGTVSTKHVWLEEMRSGGVQSPQLQEHIIKSVEDYPIVEYLLEHTEYLPDYQIIREVMAEAGDDGIIIGGAGWSPIHSLMNDYIGYNDCFFHMADYPQEFERLLQVIKERTWEMKQIAARSPAEILMVDCNWSDAITSPPIFKRYFVPILEELVDLMHSHGKLTSCHVDGDMQRLFEQFVETGVDIAEALAPQPLCNYTLAEARGFLGSRMTIWGGIPTPLFTDAYSDKQFDEYLRGIFRTIGPGDHFILAMGDNIPANGVFERAYRVTELVEELGDLPIGA